jgi:HMG (high mobility group) box
MKLNPMLSGADRWLEIREELRGQDLSFTEIAKVVGERWQILPADVREACEQQANTAKEKYYSELAEYKKTPEYALYQEYLVEFKAKHGGTRAGESLDNR